MTRSILTYGLISGTVVILGMIGSLHLPGARHDETSMVIGYLIMLVGLSSILVAVKQHRDQALGGVIRFRTAFLMGLGIAVVASVAYVIVWEIYLALTDYAFTDAYIASTLEAKRAAGVSGAEYEQAVKETEQARQLLSNPLTRMPITFTEVFPVGLIIALVSAALLRNPRFLPARSAATAG